MHQDTGSLGQTQFHFEEDLRLSVQRSNYMWSVSTYFGITILNLRHLLSFSEMVNLCLDGEEQGRERRMVTGKEF